VAPSWHVGQDAPKFAEKVTDVVGLYMNPPDKALVLCVDEKASRSTGAEWKRSICSLVSRIESRPLVRERRRRSFVEGSAAMLRSLAQQPSWIPAR
jgi:hypothetical protein